MGLPLDGYGLLPVTDAPPSLLNRFTCGKPHLDDFLTGKAPFFHRARLGLTSAVLHAQTGGHILGYFTLSNDAIKLMASEEFDLGLEDKSDLSHFPAIKLGRLAVAASHHRQGVGSDILRLAMDQMLLNSAASAARIAVVDADNDDAVIRFYERNGFVISQWAEKQAAHQGGKTQRRTTVTMLRDILASSNGA